MFLFLQGCNLLDKLSFGVFIKAIAFIFSQLVDFQTAWGNYFLLRILFVCWILVCVFNWLDLGREVLFFFKRFEKFDDGEISLFLGTPLKRALKPALAALAFSFFLPKWSSSKYFFNLALLYFKPFYLATHLLCQPPVESNDWYRFWNSLRSTPSARFLFNFDKIYRTEKRYL